MNDGYSGVAAIGRGRSWPKKFRVGPDQPRPPRQALVLTCAGLAGLVWATVLLVPWHGPVYSKVGHARAGTDTGCAQARLL
jgi:hypothetical protein